VIELSTALLDVNEVWKKVKHDEDPAREDVVAGLREIQQAYKLLDQLSIVPPAKEEGVFL
jgi:hypothetical protein